MKNIAVLFLWVWLVCAKSDDLPSLAVSVDDCVRMALENNLDISIQRLNPMIDEAAIRQALGAFDPSLVMKPNYSESHVPNGTTTPFSRTTSWSSSLQGTLPWSTGYDFNIQTSNDQSDSNAFHNEYTTFWGLNLIQPLLRGFGAGSTTATLRIARVQKNISEHEFAIKVIDVITKIHSAFHNLTYAVENQKVQLQALDLASKLLSDNRRRVQIGVMAPIEVTQAESGVASQEENVILASQEVNLRVNELKSLVAQNISDLKNRGVRPLVHGTIPSLPTLSRDEILSQALELRPDYQQAMKVIDQKHIQLKYDENQRYPQVDLKSTYGFNGMAGKLPNSFNADHSEWGVGFEIKIPLPDRITDGKLESSKLEKEKSLLQLKKVEQNVVVDVNNTLDAVHFSYQRIQAASTATKSAQAALNAETGKLKAGVSTSFVVLQLQKTLAEAKSKELRAQADYLIAFAKLHQAQGTTLQVNRVEIGR